MENPFKEILRDEKLPETLRDKVMDDVQMVMLTIDMADLIAIKYPQAAADISSALTDNLTSKTPQSKKDKS